MNGKYAVLDTETSGLFDYSKPADAEGQPRMCSLALCFLGDDLAIAREESFLVKPDGWVMDDAGEAAQVHGLTQERLMAEGCNVAHALGAYNRALDQGHIIVGFNVSFDLKMLRAELRRAGLLDRYETTQSVDCMRPMANVIKAATGGKYKIPKLVEAYRHVAGIEHEGAHGALADARACAVIFRRLVETKQFTPAQLLGVKEIK